MDRHLLFFSVELHYHINTANLENEATEVGHLEAGICLGCLEGHSAAELG